MKKKSNTKNFLKKFWFLLWKDDSLKGWVFSVIFLFVFIKFIFFPILSLATGTALPLAIVESCSMYHQGNYLSSFDSWWDKHESKYSEFGITKEEFQDFGFNKGFNKGDILFILGTDTEKLQIGDVMIFQTDSSTPIIHRIIKIEETENGRVFSTIGDNNKGQLFSEKQISENQFVGRAVFRMVPYAGWVKLVFFEPSRPSSDRGFCKEN